MTTEQTAQQLELAAQILRTGHPFEVRHDTSDKWHASLGVNPAQAALQNWCLRPVLATPPDNRPLHNPDNLTAEAVGVGYRLTVEGESVPGVGAEWWCRSSSAWLPSTGAYLPQRNTVRLPLSVPWPEPADPYAELKAAHAAGKVIQWFNGTTWIDLIKPVDPNPLWLHPAKDLRIKPEEPAFQLPPPPPGMRWHREEGWKADDLPSGYRPMCVGEKVVSTQDEVFEFDEWTSRQVHGFPVDEHPRHRTTRPLTFEHAGKTWTYHRPGDPMPCDGEARIEIVCHKGRTEQENGIKYLPRLARNNIWKKTLGWRYADEKKTVPLGREDIRCGDEVQGASGEARAILHVTQDGAFVYGLGFYSFEALQDCLRIRSLLDQLGAKNAQIEAMREAIKEACEALADLAERWEETPECHNMAEHNSAWCGKIFTNVCQCKKSHDALAKLKPLLP